MDFFATLGSNVALGLATALLPENLIYCALGVFLGTLAGVIPGIGTLAAMSLLFPLTFHLEPTAALVMLAGIYYGTAYGGSIASILLNLPGTPASAVTAIDGYPMGQSGRAGVALLMTTAASFAGASIGIVLMMAFSPFIVDIALRFGPAEYFSLMVLGLVVAATISTESPLKGLSAILVGIVFGLVGLDLYTGATRFTFGAPTLYDGISIVALAMGLFGISEIIGSIRESELKPGQIQDVSLRSMLPTRDDLRRSGGPILRGAGVGSFFGTLPGTGGTIASFVSYAIEKRISRTPERFGHGAIEGIMAPESANNAADQTAFIPTMALGIPGTASMAMMLGVLMIHGLTPGPSLMTEAPDLFWGLIMSFWIGNLLLLLINIPMIGIWVRLLRTPYHYLYPTILVFICFGTYSVANSTVDIWFVILFGALGYCARLLSYPMPPLLLGFVLGPLMEEHFRRAALYSRGDLTTFVTEPISCGFLIVTLIVLVSSFFFWARRPKNGAIVAPVTSSDPD
jgi:TctA family transporter